MPSPTIQFKRGVASGITSFKAGEPAFTTDTFDFYIGLDNTSANNKYFGSSRYWRKETTTVGSGVNLVEGTNNGTEFITLASPASVGAAVTYTFPAAPVDGQFLKTNATGTLSWSNDLGDINTTGITVGIITVTNLANITSTTDSLTVDTGALIIDGGVGIEKSVNIGGNLNVAGVSTFVGTATFKGGTINLGDANTDDINVAGEFISNLVPNADVTYDIGTPSQTWRTVYARNLNIAGISTFNGFLDINSDVSIQNNLSLFDLSVTGITTIGGKIDGNGTLEIDGDVTFNAGHITTGISTFNGAIDANAALSVDGITTLSGNLVSSGFSTFQNGVQVNSYLNVSSGTTLSSTLAVTGIASLSNNINVGGSADITGNLRVSGISTIGSDSADTLTVKATATFEQPIVGTIGTATRAVTVDTTSTSTNAAYFPTFVDSSSTTSGATIRVDSGISYNPSTDALTVPTLNTQFIKTSGGVSSIEITEATGNVGINSNLTVTGNLFVLGSTTEVNTQTLKVEDSLIEIGLVNSSGLLIAPTSDLNIDVGILFNWYDSSAKKAGIFWDDSVKRIGIGSEMSESSSIMSVAKYAEIEIGGLWVTDCAGTSQVISCSGSERSLLNITVDGGSF